MGSDAVFLFGSPRRRHRIRLGNDVRNRSAAHGIAKRIRGLLDIDMALDVVLRTNPAENILKNIDDEDLQEQSRDQVQSMMNEWLDMYRDLLEEGRPLPRDLIGRSAELAEEMRESEPRVSPESRGGRR